MRTFTTLPQEDLRKVGPAAQAIEADGYTGVSTQENRHDPFLALAVAGVATKKIELHTGVAISFPRSPMVAANIGWDLAASTGGRFTLGLGSQIRAAQREALLGAVVGAGAAHARVHPGGAGDLGGVEGRRQAQLRGQALPLHPDDAELRAGALRRAGAAHRARRGRAGDAEGRGRGIRRGQAPCLLHAQVSRESRSCRSSPRGSPSRAASARTSRSRAAASSSPARTTRRSPSCSTGCATAWPSTARRRPTGRCSRSTGSAISAASSTP